MNETELDRLLDTWKAPAAPAALRDSLRARFPRVERRTFANPLRWAVAIAAISAALAIGMENREEPFEPQVARFVNRLYEKFMVAFETWRAPRLVVEIRQSDPKVYVDGQLAAPLEYGGGASLNVHVPGDGVYSIITISHPRLTGWVEAGKIHGNVIEFRAGSKQVRIECNKPLVDWDRPVFVFHRR